MRAFNTFLIISLFCFSCQSKPSEGEQLLAKAHEKQTQAIALIGELEQSLEATSIEARDSLIQVLHELEESLFEIPGYHLELPGHEGHDHGHSKIELSNQAIYDVQVDLLKQLNEIKKIVTHK